jgi:hypothetical protein
MDQNTGSHKKKEFISKQMKLLITAASVAGALGLGGIFSKTDAQNTNLQATDAALPTLATLVSVDTSSVSTGNSAVTDTVSSSLPVVAVPTTSVSAAPVVSTQAPAPITITKSSR